MATKITGYKIETTEGKVYELAGIYWKKYYEEERKKLVKPIPSGMYV